MGEKVSILVVEDDVDINGLLCRILKKQNYEVSSAYSGSEAKMCINMYNYDLILLDLMLPGLSGEELIEEVRKTKTMPIIIISAKTELSDKVKLLKLGADDYITKPFEISEVTARVEAQLRRYKKFNHIEDTEQLLIYKNLVLDKETMKVTVNGSELILTVREFSILELLLKHPKKVFTRENLYKNVWNEEFYGEDNTVNVHISNIRAKISKLDKETEYIKTIWGVGFTMAE
ncbi:response regulator transcription factor [Clostridium sp. UBA1056]|uniref:response regulator transcription factor n=1 Tax=unclassified Clostridium TaxID=2614128 RepID=UPI003217B956